MDIPLIGAEMRENGEKAVWMGDDILSLIVNIDDGDDGIDVAFVVVQSREFEPNGMGKSIQSNGQ